jgi:D-amino-acid oxidase
MVGRVRYDKTDVTVIGAGVIGLTTAICLAEAGASVAVHAAEPTEQTTSIAAGAVWGPHLVGSDARVAAWAATTLGALLRLAGTDGEPAVADPGGHPFVRLATGTTAARRSGSAPPDFAATAASLVTCDAGQVPAGYRSAWRLSAPLVSMPEYLAYLADRYLRAGGQPVTRVTYPSLAAAVRDATSPVLVNCPGAGARDLVPDPDVVAARGQVVITANPGLTEFFVGIGEPSDPDDMTYFFPHGNRVVLGGTEELGRWSREPDEAIAARILASCAAVEPALRDAPVLAHRVGLRPFRPQVRLEAERTAGPVVVHNYGHGGAGVTLSWGCAADAAALALAELGG